MADLERLAFRLARASDADAIAVLHANSWRRFYRDAYSDDFLDGDVYADRRAVWNERLRGGDDGRCTIVAENEDAIVGFAHTVFDEDPTWGALLDNLHVAPTHQRRGIGGRLLVLSASAVVDHAPGSGLYLWVLEQNVGAQAFYRALGGRLTERAPAEPPGGIEGRLNGSPMKLRCAWPDPSSLGSAS